MRDIASMVGWKIYRDYNRRFIEIIIEDLTED